MKHPFRIKGLVAATNHIRAELRAGIVPAEVQPFQNRVIHLTQQVEQLCVEHGSQPSQLPLPSYQAYQFLKSIDFNHLPLRTDASDVSVSQVRIKNLQKVCDWAQMQFAQLTDWPADAPQVITFGQTIQTQATTVESILQKAGQEPAGLPMLTQRAYSWLKFLSTPENLALHRRALQTIQPLIPRPKPTAPGSNLPKIGFEFYNIPHLYRARTVAGHLQITASEGLIAADESIWRAVIEETTTHQHHQAELLHAFAVSDDCIDILAELDAFTIALDSNPRGVYHDLEQVFARVNAAYFKETVSKPKLAWNKTPTYRKLGQYQPGTNTIVLSLTLDSATVPAYAIDFVMYHEMLHQVLGIRQVNSQKYAHTPIFREAEKKFHEYAQAKQALDGLLQRLL